MIDWFTSPFATEAAQRALLGGLLAAAATSVVGTWVVLRGMTFLGDALAHGILPGVALAMIWGFDPMLGAFVAALVMSGLVSLVSARAHVREETGIGLLFVGMLALGVMIVSRSKSFTEDVTDMLFGDIAAITPRDLRGQLIVAVLVLAATVVLYRPFITLSFNRDKAATLGMHPVLAQAAMLAMLAMSIVASFQAMGTLLVFGLLVAPPSTALLFVRRVPLVMAASVGLGALSVVVGLVASHHAGTAGGATVAGVAVAGFFVALVAREVIDAVQRLR